MKAITLKCVRGILSICIIMLSIGLVYSAFLPHNSKYKIVHEVTQRTEELSGVSKENKVRLIRSISTPFLNHLFQIFSVHQFFKQLETTGLCLSCKFGVFILQKVIETGASEDKVGDIVNTLCLKFHIETKRVCKGVTNLFKGEVVQVLSKVALSPSEVCGIMIGPACGTVINPLHNWTIPLTPFPKPPVEPFIPPKPGAPITRVLHISDVHFDPYYKEGSNANCNEPLCCRGADSNPKTPEDAAGLWGDYRNCDTPLRTLENMLDHITKTHKIDYVIWTGDIPPHDIWNGSKTENSYLLNAVSKMMGKYFGRIPVFPALGNHESSPVNSFPIPQIIDQYSISWLYDQLYTAWSSWLPSQVKSTLKLGGYFSVEINPKFRIISMNMNYCNNLNWWLLINSTDPSEELSWLVNQLQTSELKGEKVHIIGHIPPGNYDCLKVWSANYYRIINRYESTVAAQFFGHTHMDEYEVFYDLDNSSRATNIAFIGPSVTTYDKVNPGYRIYTIDGNYPNSSRMVLDHETYYLNLTEANLTNKPQWRFEYSARKAYNMSSLQPAEWDKLTKMFQNNDKLFQIFYRFYVKLSDSITKPCTGQCKTDLICRLQHAHSEGLVCEI